MDEIKFMALVKLLEQNGGEVSVDEEEIFIAKALSRYSIEIVRLPQHKGYQLFLRDREAPVDVTVTSVEDVQSPALPSPLRALAAPGDRR